MEPTFSFEGSSRKGSPSTSPKPHAHRQGKYPMNEFDPKPPNRRLLISGYDKENPYIS